MKRNSPTRVSQAGGPAQTALAVPAEAQAALAKVAAATADAREQLEQSDRAAQVFDNMLYAARLAHEHAGIGRYVRPRDGDESRRAAERTDR